MKKFFTYLMVTAGVLGSAQLLQAQTSVPALIQSNQVWDISGSPYNINQNTYIDTGVTVTVMPGVEVIAQNNTIVLEVDGEFQAKGTVDSMILFDQLQIKLDTDAEPFNSSTGSGAHFDYCSFTGPGVGKRVIWVNGISARIENCLFTDSYYSIYAYGGSQSSSVVDILNNTFNDSTGTSFPIYTTGYDIQMNITGNAFNNFDGGGGLVMYGGLLNFSENTVMGHNYVRVRSKGSLITCNEFTHISRGIEVMLYDQDTLYGCEFTNNTIDSCGSTVLNDPMLKLWKSSSMNLNGSKFNNNNFLHLIGSGYKVEIYGGNPTPTTSETVDFTDNYWVSTDSATIEGFIEDYADNINIFGRADFSGYLSAIDSSCKDSSSCAASFYLAVDTTQPYYIYIVENSQGVTSATDFTWTFGDGGQSSVRRPTHSYTDFGLYNVCLRLENQAENCLSVFCDEVGMDSSGAMLKNGAFTINVVDEDDLTSIFNRDLSKSIQVFPNPSQGKFFIQIDESAMDELSLQVVDMTGKLVHQEEAKGLSGKHLVDVAELPAGIYLLRVQVGAEQFTTKINIRK